MAGSAFATLGYLVLAVPAVIFEPQAVTSGFPTQMAQVSLSQMLLVASSLLLLGAIATYGASRTRGLVSRALDTRTFLFADLRDYTTFVEQRGDGEAAELIADYRRLVRAEIARTGGGEIKTEGDSFFLVFTSARQAVDCAIGILRAADETTDAPRPIRVGVGIHAGEPVPHEGQFVGSAVNIAARLGQNAAAGELLVSEVIRGLLRTSGAPAMEERTGMTLKGISDAPHVYEMEWRSAAP